MSKTGATGAGSVNQGRFDTLDGLRGIAAIMVMLFHAGDRLPVRAVGGYLAVDLFFALSGFVIALAYEDRLRQGFPFSRFLIVRLIRSYPMYLVGMLVGAWLYWFDPIHLAMLPSFTSPDKLYPVNAPMWSLILELVVNLAYAAVVPVLGNRALAAILLASGAVFAKGVIDHGGADLGAFWSGAFMGLMRTVPDMGRLAALSAAHRRADVRPRRPPLGGHRRRLRDPARRDLGRDVLGNSAPAGAALAGACLLPVLLHPRPDLVAAPWQPGGNAGHRRGDHRRCLGAEPLGRSGDAQGAGRGLAAGQAGPRLKPKLTLFT